MRVTLVHNPKAGEGHPAKSELMDLLRSAGLRPIYVSTKEADIASALEDPGAFVVVAGGDGTVGKVAGHLAGRGVPLAVLPLGTANNIARSLGIRGTPRELVGGWTLGSGRPLDVGLLQSPWGTAHFIEAVGFGLFPRTLSLEESGAVRLEGRNREESIRNGRRLLVELAHSVPVDRYAVTVDGRDHSGEYVLLEVMNTGWMGSGLRFSSAVRPDDGLLHLILVKPEARERLAAHLAAQAPGEEDPPYATVLAGKQIRIEWDGQPLHVDDELWPESDEHGGAGAEPAPARIDIQVKPGALDVLVPPA